MLGKDLSNLSSPNSTYLDRIERGFCARPETMCRHHAAIWPDGWLSLCATYEHSVLRWILQRVVGADAQNGRASERDSSSNQQSAHRASNSPVVRSRKRENETQGHFHQNRRSAASTFEILNFAVSAQQTTKTQSHESITVARAASSPRKAPPRNVRSSARCCAPNVKESCMRLSSEQARRCTHEFIPETTQGSGTWNHRFALLANGLV